MPKTDPAPYLDRIIPSPQRPGAVRVRTGQLFIIHNPPANQPLPLPPTTAITQRPHQHDNSALEVDVFSYGVVLLEIVCCRRNMEIDPSKPEEIVLIKWAYKCFIDREFNKLVCGEEVDKKTLENMIKVGLWCVSVSKMNLLFDLSNKTFS
ncbi:hypothetical protein WN944_019325 [Citrus x changshan-huyou]|uniref:Uncharacterized protein n=1 Tax=Citrus x changshan-huyou TaxID=2935761 RepID=A0AAP0QJC6_9ROSI